MGRLSLAGLGLWLALSATASAAPLHNPRFSDTAGGLPAGWRVEAWARDLTDVTVEPPPDGRGDGAGIVKIVNRGANDARLCQSIAVTPGAEYRFSARVKTENIGLATAGALLALEPRIADSVDLKGTQDWQTIEVTATNREHSSWDVCLRLGSYANLNTGTAWFTDVRVDTIGGPAPAAEGSRWPTVDLTPLLVGFRQTSWMHTALPLGGGLLLAFGLGLFRRRPR